MSDSKPRVSRTALLGFLFTAGSYPLFGPSFTQSSLGVSANVFLAILVAGFFFSVLGWMRVASSDGKLRGLPFAFLGLAGLIPWALLFMGVLKL